jgi:hypothetical protein
MMYTHAAWDAEILDVYPTGGIAVRIFSVVLYWEREGFAMSWSPI